MIRFSSVSLALTFLSASTFQLAVGQTAPSGKAPVRHTTASAASAGMSANAPGIPKVTALPKTLFTLKYVDLVVGTGELAVPRKFYTVNYTGWLTTGKKFDSSYDRGEPITFPYGARRVIAGWDTGFEGMRVGGKRRLLIPYELAYGELGNQVIPAKSNLIFDVELLGISDTPPAAPAPPAAAAPPAEGAQKPTAPTAPSSTTPTPPSSTTPAPPSPGAPAAPTTPAPPSRPSAPNGN